MLSIDIGFHTFDVLNALDTIEPDIIVTEYNSKYGPKIEWKVDYDESKDWDGTDNYGASLKSFEIMMSKKDYVLVACNVTGVNAFY